MTYFNLKFARTGSLWRIKFPYFKEWGGWPVKYKFLSDTGLSICDSNYFYNLKEGADYCHLNDNDFLLCLDEEQEIYWMKYKKFLHTRNQRTGWLAIPDASGILVKVEC